MTCFTILNELRNPTLEDSTVEPVPIMIISPQTYAYCIFQDILSLSFNFLSLLQDRGTFSLHHPQTIWGRSIVNFWLRIQIKGWSNDVWGNSAYLLLNRYQVDVYIDFIFDWQVIRFTSFAFQSIDFYDTLIISIHLLLFYSFYSISSLFLFSSIIKSFADAIP